MHINAVSKINRVAVKYFFCKYVYFMEKMSLLFRILNILKFLLLETADLVGVIGRSAILS